LETAESNTPEEPRRTSEESNRWFQEYIGLTDKKRTKRQTEQGDSRSPGWTGQNFPVGSLMQLAVANPKAFCELFVAAFLRPPTKWQRGLAARNAFSSDYKKAILEAAYRVGNDGNGKDGVVGYFSWVGECHPAIFYTVLYISLLPLETAESNGRSEVLPRSGPSHKPCAPDYISVSSTAAGGGVYLP
jgi:hypothetical protein